MGKILGLIGGGQLGMMIAEAAKKMPDEISEIIVLDPTENCPAVQVGATQIIADFKDREAIIDLATKCDIITYEIESGDSDVLKSVEDKSEINPSPDTLKIIQDKFLQKSFLRENNIPVREFIEIKNIDDVKTGLKKFGIPAMLKARRDAYDGRGNFKINSENDIQTALLEVERVNSRGSFITVDAYRNDKEKERMEAWNLTAKTVMHVDEWKQFFDDIGYTGDYYWFIP